QRQEQVRGRRDGPRAVRGQAGERRGAGHPGGPARSSLMTTTSPEWTVDEHGALTETRFVGLTLVSRGKVRDIYDLGEHLLIVTTDRISAFDWVLPNGIPDKGRVLNQLSAFWFNVLGNIVPNHLVSIEIGGERRVPARYHAVLGGRAMIVRKAEVFPV